MLVISANEQRNLVNMNEVIEYAALGFKRIFRRKNDYTNKRLITICERAKYGINYAFSSGRDLRVLGVKIVTVVPQNKQIGKKTINGIVMLSDFQTGEPLALLEGSYNDDPNGRLIRSSDKIFSSS